MSGKLITNDSLDALAKKTPKELIDEAIETQIKIKALKGHLSDIIDTINEKRANKEIKVKETIKTDKGLLEWKQQLTPKIKAL